MLKNTKIIIKTKVKILKLKMAGHTVYGPI